MIAIKASFSFSFMDRYIQIDGYHCHIPLKLQFPCWECSAFLCALLPPQESWEDKKEKVHLPQNISRLKYLCRFASHIFCIHWGLYNCFNCGNLSDSAACITFAFMWYCCANKVNKSFWLLLTMSYVVTTFLRTSGSRPWGSKLGYWSVRLNTRRGLLSGPVSREERAKMHCFRLATAERPHSSLKDTIAFCREKK